MSSAGISDSKAVPVDDVDRNVFPISVAMYHEMIESGILTPDDRVELLDGILVTKMPQNDRHIFVSEQIRDLLTAMLSAGYHINSQRPVQVPGSEPEPDLTIIRGVRSDYLSRKPTGADTPLIVEVADTSLARDRAKCALYALGGYPCYWIVNVNARQVEVYTQPDDDRALPGYEAMRTYAATDAISIECDGVAFGMITIADLFPGK